METRARKNHVDTESELTSNCAVLLCGVENVAMYPCCTTHRLHLECLNRLFETNDEPTCPICRDPFLKIVKDICIKNPCVVDEDDEEDEDTDTYGSEDGEDDEMHLCSVHHIRQENESLRRLVREMSAQYIRDYDTAQIHSAVASAVVHLTRSPPLLSPARLRPRDPFS